MVVQPPSDKLEEEKEEVVKKLDYVAPPKYTEFGQGLVYNCKGKHWACVDREAYIKCEGNMNWAKQEGKPNECATSKILASEYDCRTLQMYYINTVAETPNCN